MREIFFDEKLGETRRNSEGGASRTGREGGSGGSCGSRDGSGEGRNGIFGGETRRDFETLGETRSEGGDGGLKVGKERVVHFFGGINLLR